MTIVKYITVETIVTFRLNVRYTFYQKNSWKNPIKHQFKLLYK